MKFPLKALQMVKTVIFDDCHSRFDNNRYIEWDNVHLNIRNQPYLMAEFLHEGGLRIVITKKKDDT